MKSYRQLFKICPYLGYRYQESLRVTVLGDENDSMPDYPFRSDRYGFRNSGQPTLDGMSIGDLFIGCSFVAGDGVANSQRFSSLLHTSSRPTYNSGLSGACFAQMSLIAAELKTYRPTVDRLWFMPYIGAIRRSFLRSRGTFSFNGRVNWSKPHFVSRDGATILQKLPSTKPSIQYSTVSNPSTQHSSPANCITLVSQLVADLPRPPFTAVLSHTFSSILSDFPLSQIIFAPIPSYDLILASSSDRNTILNSYKQSVADLPITFLDLFPILRSKNYFYAFDGHLNKNGHERIAEFLAGVKL